MSEKKSLPFVLGAQVSPNVGARFIAPSRVPANGFRNLPGRNELRPYINKAVEVVGHDHDHIVENYHAAVLADFSAK